MLDHALNSLWGAARVLVSGAAVPLVRPLVSALWHWLMSPTFTPGRPAGHVMCGRDCEQCMLGTAQSL